MSGEKDLERLLSSMNPVLEEQEYVFVTFPDGKYGDGAHLLPVGTFMEKEGLTMIVPMHTAEEYNLRFEGGFRCISLQVHSSLEAVGLTAAISARLASAGISANVVAAYFHDHVFVPSHKAPKALTVLTSPLGKSD